MEVSPGNTPPEAAIAAPATYRDGQTIDLGGSADDAEDGDVPTSAYEWDIELMHGTHRHPKTSESGVTSTSFEASTDHDADSHYVVRLTVTDGRGIKGTDSVRIDPETARLTLASSPPGPGELRRQLADLTVHDPVGDRLRHLDIRRAELHSRRQDLRVPGWSDGGTRLHDGDSSKSTIFGYDSGAAMAGLAAPARRLGFFLSNFNATALTTNGWKLFDAAVGWAKNGS